MSIKSIIFIVVPLLLYSTIQSVDSTNEFLETLDHYKFQVVIFYDGSQRYFDNNVQSNELHKLPLKIFSKAPRNNNTSLALKEIPVKWTSNTGVYIILELEFNSESFQKIGNPRQDYFFSFQYRCRSSGENEVENIQTKNPTNNMLRFFSALHFSSHSNGTTNLDFSSAISVIKNSNGPGWKNSLAHANAYHFKISANYFPPYSFNKGIGDFDGSHYQLLNNSASKFNFTYSICTPESKSTGIEESNGSWTGIMGDITHLDYDLALIMTPTERRYCYVDFTSTIGVSHLIFLSTTPEISISKLALMSPYTTTVWIYVFFVFLIVVAALYFDLKVKKKVKFNLKEVILVTTAMFVEQSGKRLTGTRFIPTLWMIFVMIIGTGYKCNLASFLATPETLDKPKTFTELNDAPEYKIYFDLSGIAGYQYLNKSEQPLLKSIKKRTIPTSSSSVCLLNIFDDPNSVCIGWDVTLPLTVARNLSISSGKRSIMYQSEKSILFTYGSIALRKQSLFTDLFNFIGVSYFESGLIDKWASNSVNYFSKVGVEWTESLKGTEFYEKLHKAAASQDKEGKALEFKHFEILFHIYLLICYIASIRFVYEVLMQ